MLGWVIIGTLVHIQLLLAKKLNLERKVGGIRVRL